MYFFFFTKNLLVYYINNSSVKKDSNAFRFWQIASFKAPFQRHINNPKLNLLPKPKYHEQKKSGLIRSMIKMIHICKRWIIHCCLIHLLMISTVSYFDVCTLKDRTFGGVILDYIRLSERDIFPNWAKMKKLDSSNISSRQIILNDRI